MELYPNSSTGSISSIRHRLFSLMLSRTIRALGHDMVDGHLFRFRLTAPIADVAVELTDLLTQIAAGFLWPLILDAEVFAEGLGLHGDEFVTILVSLIGVVTAMRARDPEPFLTLVAFVRKEMQRVARHVLHTELLGTVAWQHHDNRRLF